MTYKTEENTSTEEENESATEKFTVSMHSVSFQRVETLKKKLKTSRSRALAMLVDHYAEALERKMTKKT